MQADKEVIDRTILQAVLSDNGRPLQHLLSSAGSTFSGGFTIRAVAGHALTFERDLHAKAIYQLRVASASGYRPVPKRTLLSPPTYLPHLPLPPTARSLAPGRPVPSFGSSAGRRSTGAA